MTTNLMIKDQTPNGLMVKEPTRNTEPRAREYPYPCRVREELTLSVAPGFGGLAVFIPDGMLRGPFRLVLVVSERAGSITFRPDRPGTMVVDVPDRYFSTPEKLQALVQTTWLAAQHKDPATAPVPPGVPVMGDHP
jgi:hypothetical protein